MKTLAPAVPLMLILGTRWQAQLSVQLAFRQDLLSRRPIALDRLLCVVPNRLSHCSQALHHALLRPKSSIKYTRRCPDGPWSCCVTIVAFKFSALPFRWHAMQRSRFLDPIFRENGVFVCHWRLANPDSMGPISDPDGLLARMCTCTSLFLRMAIFGSCTLSQKHAQTQFSRRFSLEISSSTMLHVKSNTLTRCCRLVVFLAEDPQVITTSHDRHH